MSVLEELKAARARISEPGTWCKYNLHTIEDGKDAYCAVGALCRGGTGITIGRSLALDELQKTLQKRFFMGTLPTATAGCGFDAPKPWEKIVKDRGTRCASIAQFNNSTSQAEVLALFDEAIADNTPKPEPADEPVTERELVIA